MKAVALVSGGLDSALAVGLMVEQGIELHVLNFITTFCTCTPNGGCHEASKVATRYRLPIKVINTTNELIEVVKNPKHGYGRNMNPCIDCRILGFKKAKEFMKEIGASFVVTGEVIGERPMSQNRNSMALIEKESGLEGLIVRPLCAKHLPPSVPEQKGWVDRNRLLAIEGRSRKPQIELAEQLHINDYPCPSGGCLLTDEGFSKRIKDALHDGGLDSHTAQLLKIGRHFRLPDGSKLIVGRDEGENEKLLTLLGTVPKKGDSPQLLYKIYVKDYAGPMGTVPVSQGDSPQTLLLACRIVARYSKARELAEVEVCVSRADEKPQILKISPASDEEIGPLRI